MPPGGIVKGWVPVLANVPIVVYAALAGLNQLSVDEETATTFAQHPDLEFGGAPRLGEWMRGD